MKVTKEVGFVPADTTITTGDPVFIDIANGPFSLHGFYEPFRRIPKSVAEATSPAVADLSATAAGGRIRFRTDSDYVVIHFTLSSNPASDSMIYSGVCGLLCIKDGRHLAVGAFNPSQGEGKDYYESRVRLAPGMKDLMIELPIYARIKNFAIALREGSEVLCGSDYERKTPVVFYGSSIVHGVGSSRPSCTYPSIISRRLNTDFINLGFAGAALCEDAVMNYIASLKMSVFVYDYDHNAPSVEYLEKTHYNGYKNFRLAQPDTPVILASRPDYWSAGIEENEKRRQIILETYHRGLAAGDKLLWFVDGKDFYEPEYREESTADGCHPNDVGYLQMAKKIGAAISEAFEKTGR